jgi:chromosomal replication initiator protein
VIYGGVGLGKTHLLQAIGHHALSQNSGQRVAFVPSEKFMSDFIEAIKTEKTAQFRSLYRSPDLLLVDDIQFLLRGEQTQNEFFHTFNALHQNGKQIVMTCDGPPGQLQGMEERLVSRFQWGLVTSIEPPDLETRIAILQQKAEITGLALPDEVAIFLGNYISSNIRELEGALIHLMAYCSVNRMELTIEAARQIVQERGPAHVGKLSIEAIQQAVAEHFNLTPQLLIAKTRKQEIVRARQVAMFLAKRLTQNPLKAIGLRFGSRDHSTVVHAIQMVEQKRRFDPHFSQLIDSLAEAIQGKHPSL